MKKKKITNAGRDKFQVCGGNCTKSLIPCTTTVWGRDHIQTLGQFWTPLYTWPPTQSFLKPISKRGKYFAKVVARGSSKLADLLHIWTILVGNPQKLIFLYIAIQRYIFFNLFHVESLTYLFDQTKPMQYSLVNKNQNSYFRLLNVQ